MASCTGTDWAFPTAGKRCACSVHRQLDKLNHDLVLAGFYELNPIPLGLTDMRGPPDAKKYNELKAKINAIWPETDVIEAALTQLRDGEPKSKVQAYITAVNIMKNMTGFVTRTLDAIVEYGPQGAAHGALSYDPTTFNSQCEALDKLLRVTTTAKYIDAVSALNGESTSLSKKLRVIDQSLDK